MEAGLNIYQGKMDATLSQFITYIVICVVKITQKHMFLYLLILYLQSVDIKRLISKIRELIFNHFFFRFRLHISIK